MGKQYLSFYLFTFYFIIILYYKIAPYTWLGFLHCILILYSSFHFTSLISSFYLWDNVAQHWFLYFIYGIVHSFHCTTLIPSFIYEIVLHNTDSFILFMRCYSFFHFKAQAVYLEWICSVVLYVRPHLFTSQHKHFFLNCTHNTFVIAHCTFHMLFSTQAINTYFDCTCNITHVCI